MSNELKPCPFAKPGEVHHTRTITAVGESWVLCSCGASGPTFSGVDSERKAIEAWNTRAERTCHINWDKELFCFACDSCDHISMMAPDSRPTYCPNCGAKVVE